MNYTQKTMFIKAFVASLILFIFLQLLSPLITYSSYTYIVNTLYEFTWIQVTRQKEPAPNVGFCPGKILTKGWPIGSIDLDSSCGKGTGIKVNLVSFFVNFLIIYLATITVISLSTKIRRR